MTTIISPVNGQIISMDSRKITIYISVNDNHQIYAPLGGEITYMSITNGSWKRKYYTTVFNKTGHLTVEINNIVSFWVEVGKPKYVTDTIRVDYEMGDTVEQGKVIGEIIIGSLAQIAIPPDGKILKGIKEGTKLVGGETALYTIKEEGEYVLKEKAILLTVPHGYCQNDTFFGRRCDRRAEESANILGSILKSKTNIKIITVKSQVDRQSMDENRIQSRHDKFRNEIDEIIEQYDVIWIIDMHSFPLGGFQPQSSNWPYLKFVTLDDVSRRTTKEHYIFDFEYEYYEMLTGSTLNDIEEESRNLGIPSILIEVLEDEQLTDTELRGFLTVVANRILKNKDIKEIYYQ
jgi:hypothetical protein